MSPPRVLAVFGATGHQGGAIISHFLSLPNPPYTICALTRNPLSSAAQKLSAAGIQVYGASLDDPSSLATALKDVHAVFLVTDFFSCADETAAHEQEQAKRVLNILAASPTLEHVIYSSLPSIRAASGGRYNAVVHFDGKAEVVAWLERTHEALWAKTTVLWVGTYMQLWKQFRDVFAPRKTLNDGTEVWVQKSPFYEETKLPLVDVRDVGRAVRVILERGRDLAGGTTVSLVAPNAVSVKEQLYIWGRSVEQQIKFQHVSEEESWKAIEQLGFPGFLARDVWETSLAFRDCEGRLLHQESVIQASEILPVGERLASWTEYVEAEDWTAFLES